MVSTVQKSYRKNILREMKSSISRVVSLFGIVALGVMMLTGLMCIAPDMRTAAQKYYVQQNVFDLRVLSTLGLSQSDISAIAAVDGVDAVQAVKYQDVEGHWTGDEQTTVARLYQLPADPQADTPENMNRPVLLSGRMPEAAGECVVHVMGHGSPVELGTQLTLPEETEGVSGQVFTVVGTVQDPLHFSSDSESSTVGDGQLDCILFVPEGTLTADYYTVCYIKAENAGLYDNYSDEYQAAVDAVAEKLKAIQSVQCTARREELMDTANDKLTEARAEYDSQKAEAERQFAEAEAKLADAQQQLDAAKTQLEAGEKELAAQKTALPDTMQSGADKLVSSEEQVLEFEEQLQQIELLVNLKKVADPLLTYAEAALRNAEKALDEAEPEDEDYIELRDALAKAQAAYDNIYNQLQGYQQQLDAGKRQMYKQGLISSPNLSNDQLVTEAKAALRKMKLQLLQGQLQLTTGTASAYTQFDAAQKQLEEGWAEYNAGQTQLEESRTEYESQKAEAEQKLADGLAQLNDAEEQVNQIKKGEWYVLDRTSTMSCVTFAQYADRMDAIARVFPVFFFLVAALVALTTMTRMVEEERGQVGTMKALGYTRGQIAAKYILYALAASLAGSAVGMLIGMQLFPRIILSAYNIMYDLPELLTPFNWGYGLLATGAAVACTLLATLNACWAELREQPASLMLPKAPKAGKRILLEHIGPVWRRLKFTHKVTARNLFLYKKRFFMTVVGIAGCTALLVTGFGLHDSISDIVEKQFDELAHYQMLVSLQDPSALEGRDLSAILEDDSQITGYLAMTQEDATVVPEEGNEADNVYITVPSDTGALNDYFTFRQRTTGEAVPFEEGSVIITEKLAERQDVGVGDTITVENADGKEATFTITGVCENYVYHYLYMSADVYREAFGEDPEVNLLYCSLADGVDTPEAEDELSTALLKCRDVAGAQFTHEITASFSQSLGSINYIVVVLIIAAGALAFVVLYNLTNINITERSKELATIKVLGFYDNEVGAYIYRETSILALIGTACGLLFGIALHTFVIRTAEVDMVMFGRSIYPMSFVWSALLTILFSVLVNLVMYRKLKNISMVESMKAPE